MKCFLLTWVYSYGEPAVLGAFASQEEVGKSVIANILTNNGYVPCESNLKIVSLNFGEFSAWVEERLNTWKFT